MAKVRTGIELNEGEAQGEGGGEQRRVVEKHRQCPLCYTGDNNGVGEVYATRGKKQYRKCDRCGHTFVTPTQAARTDIRHGEVELNER